MSSWSLARPVANTSTVSVSVITQNSCDSACRVATGGVRLTQSLGWRVTSFGHSGTNAQSHLVSVPIQSLQVQLVTVSRGATSQIKTFNLESWTILKTITIWATKRHYFSAWASITALSKNVLLGTFLWLSISRRESMIDNSKSSLVSSPTQRSALFSTRQQVITCGLSSQVRTQTGGVASQWPTNWVKSSKSSVKWSLTVFLAATSFKSTAKDRCCTRTGNSTFAVSC